jgi:hypothetical protein
VSGNGPDAMHCTYEPPRLVDLNSPPARGDCCNCYSGTSVTQGTCGGGCCAQSCSSVGTGAFSGCSTGAGAHDCTGGTGGYGCYNGSSPGLCNCGHDNTYGGGCNCGYRAPSIEGSMCCTSGDCYNAPYP